MEAIKTSSIITVLALSALVGLVDASARLVKVPLLATTTSGAGALGQPIISYYASLSVGTPAKPFKIQFDLDTNELFLPHYSWNPFNRNLHYSTGFQCKVSSTCVKDNNEFKIEYQHVKLTGKRYEDVMTLDAAHGELGSSETNSTQAQLSTAPSTGTTISSRPAIGWRQNFLAISSASDGRFGPLAIDGFFGLGPASQSPTGLASLMTNLHRANLIDNLQFSFWFNPALDSSNGGALVLGGVDTDRYQGKIYWHQLSSAQPNRWSLGLQSVALGGQTVGCTAQYRAGCQARFSTGLSDIYGPREDVQRIYSLLNTTKSSAGLQLIDCRRIPSLPFIIFNIDGIPYYLPASNYVRKTVDGSIFKKETCYVAILPSIDEAGTWILSTPFLGAYYSTFDVTYRQIGFASLR